MLQKLYKGVPSYISEENKNIIMGDIVQKDDGKEFRLSICQLEATVFRFRWSDL
jgi:hypothetical protein